MLLKYWSVFLIVALSLAACFTPGARTISARARRGSRRCVFLAAIAPHVWWLIRENFPPITWVTWRRVSPSFADTLQSLFECLAGTAGYAAVAIALVLFFVRPSPARARRRLFPARRAAQGRHPFWVPILLPVVPALIKNINLLSLWNMPALNLLPVMLLGSPLVVLPRVAVLRIAGRGAGDHADQRRALAHRRVHDPQAGRGEQRRLCAACDGGRRARMARDARDRGKPLKLIAGPFVLVSSAAFYGKDQPSTSRISRTTSRPGSTTRASCATAWRSCARRSIRTASRRSRSFPRSRPADGAAR